MEEVLRTKEKHNRKTIEMKIKATGTLDKTETELKAERNPNHII